MRKYRTFKELHIEMLQDPLFRSDFLQHCLEEFIVDGDKEMLLLAMHDSIEALGGTKKMSEETRIPEAVCQAIYAGEVDINQEEAQTLLNQIKSHPSGDTLFSDITHLCA